ncbi:MAG: sugar phosphate isomerase/epimerase [bacterium]|nr:sugar phosphate isomerase/epimerase [bacterium]
MTNAAVLGACSRPLNQLSFADACRRIAAAGYDHVALFANQGKAPVRSDSTAAEVVAAAQAARDAGLAPSMVLGRTRLDVDLEEAAADYRRLIDNAAEVGARWILDLGSNDEAQYDTYLELMRRVAPHAEEAGIGISMKPHGGISLTVEHLLATANAVDHPAFGICFDPGNIIYYTAGERRPEGDVEKVAARVSTFIVKDCVVEGDKPDVMVTPGTGLVDFPLVLAKLRAAGFNGPYYVECVGGGPEADAIERELTYTRGFIEGILRALPLTG